MFKSILVALDGSEHAEAATGYTLWLAERWKATVTGLHVIDIVSIEGSFFHDISGSLGFEPFFDSAKIRDALAGLLGERLEQRLTALLQDTAHLRGEVEVGFEAERARDVVEEGPLDRHDVDHVQREQAARQSLGEPQGVADRRARVLRPVDADQDGLDHGVASGRGCSTPPVG